eukprot:TRINITY_DN21243_c0_g1_i1.p1 TRINITY_DN21243_c0_g1~~TRINITY_DN21243_c0_g1_i1.p1  ORF type:complete len:276 (+),score=55.88 TRINITY_DN21243_c0_g1_i1:87-914(+)
MQGQTSSACCSLPTCEKFEPNPFKIAILLQKENCKHCGRPWTEHQGVISENLFDGYLQAIREAADEWQKGSSPFPDDSDDDVGFRMVAPDTLTASETCCAEIEPQVHRPPKVLNLIDFRECDVAPEGHSSQACSSLRSSICASVGDLGGTMNATSPETKEVCSQTIPVEDQSQLVADLRSRLAEAEAALADAREELEGLKASHAKEISGAGPCNKPEVTAGKSSHMEDCWVDVGFAGPKAVTRQWCLEDARRRSKDSLKRNVGMLWTHLKSLDPS